MPRARKIKAIPAGTKVPKGPKPPKNQIGFGNPYLTIPEDTLKKLRRAGRKSVDPEWGPPPWPGEPSMWPKDSGKAKPGRKVPKPVKGFKPYKPPKQPKEPKPPKLPKFRKRKPL